MEFEIVLAVVSGFVIGVISTLCFAALISEQRDPTDDTEFL